MIDEVLKMAGKKIKDNPSFVKRRKEIEGAKDFKKLVDSHSLDGLKELGVDMDKLSKELLVVPGLAEQSEMVSNMPDRFNQHFTKYGWIALRSMNFEIMKKSVELADEGKLEDAEKLLIDYYDGIIDSQVSWLSAVEEFQPRMELIEKAKEDYLEGRYHACIPIVLMMIDGVIADAKKTKDQKGFHADGIDLEAWDSIAAHINGLTELQKEMTKSRKKTRTEEITIPYRNGILHGRDLGYANKTVAVKSWATLFAVKEAIIDMKKEPKEESKPTIIDAIKMHNDTQIFLNKAKNWKPRVLKVNIDFPESGSSSDYGEGTPERVFVEFLEFWIKGNYYEMAKRMCFIFAEGQNPSKFAGELRDDVLPGKNLFKYQLLDIKDESVYINVIEVKLDIQNEEGNLSHKYVFRMIYEDNEGKEVIRGDEEGSWKIMTLYPLDS